MKMIYKVHWIVDGVAEIEAESKEEAEKKLPFGQLVKTHEISPLICYLISSSSGIITGSIINYDQNIIGAVPE